MTSVEFELPESGKKKKDVNKPKKGLSAYIIFGQENRNKIKESNPEAGFGEIGKLVGEAWSRLSPEDRDVYDKKSLKSKAEASEAATAQSEAATTQTAQTEATVPRKVKKGAPDASEVPSTSNAPAETVEEKPKKKVVKKGV